MHHYCTSYRDRKLINSCSFLQGAHRLVKNIYKHVENNCNMIKNKGLKLERCLKYYVRFLVMVDNFYQSGPVTKSNYKNQKEHKKLSVWTMSEIYQCREDLKGQDIEKRQGKDIEVRPKVSIYIPLNTFSGRPRKKWYSRDWECEPMFSSPIKLGRQKLSLDLSKVQGGGEVGWGGGS